MFFALDGVQCGGFWSEKKDDIFLVCFLKMKRILNLKKIFSKYLSRCFLNCVFFEDETPDFQILGSGSKDIFEFRPQFDLHHFFFCGVEMSIRGVEMSIRGVEMSIRGVEMSIRGVEMSIGKNQFSHAHSFY